MFSKYYSIYNVQQNKQKSFETRFPLWRCKFVQMLIRLLNFAAIGIAREINMRIMWDFIPEATDTIFSFVYKK